MSAEEDEQLALGHTLWDERFQRNIINADWPATLPPPVTTPSTPDVPITPVFTDGRTAVSVFPPRPSHEYPPMTSHVLPSNDRSVQPAAPSVETIADHEAALRFQSQVAQMFRWPDDRIKPPPVDSIPTYEYPLSTGSSAPMEMRTERLHMRSMQGPDESYMTHGALPIQRPPSPPASHMPGPERSRKSTRQRIDPLGPSQGARVKQTKRASTCWRCRKYRKPVSNQVSLPVENY